MKKLIVILSVLMIAACAKDEQLVELSFLKIYMGDYQQASQVQVFDALPYTNNQVAMFGVRSPSSLFDNDGHLFVQLIGSNGATIASTFYKAGESGFPSNVVWQDNKFHLIWTDNKTFSHISVTLTNTTINIEQQAISGFCDLSPTAVVQIEATGNGGFLLLGTAKDAAENGPVYRKIFLSQVTDLSHYYSGSQNKESTAIFVQQEYSPEAFNIFSSDDMTIVRSLSHYFGIQTQGDHYLYTAPYKERIALKRFGDAETIYTDSRYWILNLAHTGSEKYLAVVSNPERPELTTCFAYLSAKNMNISFEEIYKSIDIKLDLYDNKQKIILTPLADQNITLLTGSTKAGQLVIKVLDSTTLQPQKELTIGQTYPFEVAAVIPQTSTGELLICGTTKVQYTQSRSFLMKIKLNKLSQ